MTTVDNLLAIAAQQIGITESPADSNKVKYNTWYYGREVSGSAYPWCMAFVQWCYNEAGLTLPYKTASCSALLNWYKQNHPQCVAAKPQPGDVVIYNFGHTGIVESASGSTITAIEGNTTAGSSGSQSNGGGVYRRTRSTSYVTAYVRPISAMHIIETEDDDMKYYETITEIPAGELRDTVQLLIDRKAIAGNGSGLHLSEDMVRMMVYNRRMGLYK